MSQTQSALSQHDAAVPVHRTDFGPAIVEVHGISDAFDARWKINRDHPSTFEEIADQVRALGASEMLAPIPTKENGLVVTQASLSEHFTVNGVRVFGHCYADGCLVPRGKAFVMSAADCALLCAVADDIVIGAHASRASVLGKDPLAPDLESRTHFGVVEAIIEKMNHFGFQPEDIHLGVFGGIRSNFEHLPNHPTYGEFNRSFIEFAGSIPEALTDEKTGNIDMYAVIEGVARHAGIQRIEFDDIDTGSDDNLANRNYASHRNPERGAPPVRNLQIIYHRA